VRRGVEHRKCTSKGREGWGRVRYSTGRLQLVQNHAVAPEVRRKSSSKLQLTNSGEDTLTSDEWTEAVRVLAVAGTEFLGLQPSLLYYYYNLF
jgi:hypothetical protein